MIPEIPSIHSGCPFYDANNYIGFRSAQPKKGGYYIGKKNDYNILVFVLKGEIEFSYNEYLKRLFCEGNLFFIPQNAVMYGSNFGSYVPISLFPISRISIAFAESNWDVPQKSLSPNIKCKQPM